MTTVRFPGLLETVPMAEYLAPGITPRSGAERTYLEVEPNHCVLHLAVDIDHDRIENTRDLTGVLPADYHPASGEHGAVLTSAGGGYVNILPSGRAITSPGQPELTEFSWLVGKIRYTRRPA